MSIRVKDPVVEAELIDPLRDPEWDRLVVAHPGCSLFYASAWARVLNKTYGHQPVYLRIKCDGRLAALVPMMEVTSPWSGRRGVCLPFTDLCDSLLFPDGTFKIVCAQLRDLGRKRKWKYFEIRGGGAQTGIQCSVGFYTHALDLRAGPDRVASGFASSVHRAIRKAGRSGLTVGITQTREAVVQFYRLHTLTRRRHGVPVQPLNFFLNIYHEIIEPGLGFIVLAQRGAQAVAGALFFQFGRKAVYKFGASDESLHKLRGNNLVVSEGIRHLAANQAESLDFGRTSLSNDGLRRFKRSWGAVEERIEYRKFDLATGTWVTARDNTVGFHTALFSRLPVALNRLAGSLLYPHLD